MLFTASVTASEFQLDEYVMGTEDIEYYPHYGKASATDANFSGFARELLDEFALQSGVQWQYRLLPIKRLFQLFLYDDVIDFKYPDNPAWQPHLRKGKKIYYSDPVGHYIDGVMVNSNNLSMTINDLRLLGTIRGFTPEPYLQLVETKRLRIQEFAKSDHLIQAVLSGRVDGAYLNIDVAAHKADRFSNSMSKLEFHEGLPHALGDYRVSSIRNPKIITELNDFLQKNIKYRRDLSQKYQIKFIE
jgi:hypothetical protein